MTLDLAEAYGETREDLTSFLRGLDRAALATTVPATPAWSVRDVVGHLSALAGEVSRGEAPDVFAAMIVDRSKLPLADLHSERQVAARRGLPFEDVLREWASDTERLLPLLRGEREMPYGLPYVDRMVVTDAVTHAQDVRNALGAPAGRDSLGVSVAFTTFVGGLHMRLVELGRPALRLVYGPKERVAGEGRPAATVAAERYELYRALAGRRSRRQVLSYRWTGDPDPFVPLIPAYVERVTDLVE